MQVLNNSIAEKYPSLCTFSYLLTGYCGEAGGASMKGIYYPVLKFSPKELAFHRSCMLTFPTAKNVIEGLRQRNPVVFNQAFKIFDISSDVATGWHPEDSELAFLSRAMDFRTCSPRALCKQQPSV